MPNDDLVTVMVPKRHLALVYGFIAKLDAGEPTSTAQPAPTPGTNGNVSDEWTPSRLRKMIDESPPAMINLLRAMAESPGEWIATMQLADAIEDKEDADWKTVAGTMGAFARRLKSRYGIEAFPFEKRYDHAVRGMVFRMSESMAAQILQMLGNA